MQAKSVLDLCDESFWLLELKMMNCVMEFAAES